MSRSLLLLFLLPCALQDLPAPAAQLPEQTQQHLAASALQIPLSFEANQGQTDPQVRFFSRGGGYTLFLTAGEAVLSLRHDSTATDVVRLRLLGASPEPQVAGADPQPGVSNYFLGNDPEHWRTQVPRYDRVRYEGIYPGVDLVYYGTDQRTLEHDFVVSPGADPGLIRFEAEGTDSVRVDGEGDLILHTPGGEVVLQAPVAYQEVGGVRKAVESRYVTSPPGPLSGTERGNSPKKWGVSFALGPYDPTYSLVIDPVLIFSTYLGGSGDDYGHIIAVDGSGNVYVAGRTASTNFLTANPYQAANGGGAYDAFLMKFTLAPVITSISPTSGNVGASVTIAGAGFSPTAASNTVFFGATKANVTAASTTSLTVTVPTGAAYGPISVTAGGETALSTQFFLPTFTGSGSTIDASNLAAKVDFATGTGPFGVAIGDVDGDGKPDLVVANTGANTLSVYRNQTLIVPPAPALSSPADGATGQALSPTLSWNAANGATAYQLQVSTVSNFSSTVYDNAALTGTSQGVGPLSYGTLYYWQVRGSNGNGAGAFSTARSFTTVPNTAPMATAQTASGNEDTDLTLTLAGTDAEGQSLTALISTLPANGSLYQTADGVTRGAQITSVPTTVTDASKRVIYAPLANGNGSGYGNFGFKVNDGQVDSPEATATVNITAVNDAPTLTAIADPAAVLEDAGAQTVNLAGIGSGVANETQALTVTATSSNPALIPHPTVTYTSPNATGSLSYTPVANANGTVTITVTVTDDGGTANGGVNTASQSFTVSVTPVNIVADFVLNYSSPVKSGERLDLSVSFRNPFGRLVPYTGTMRLEVPLIELGGEGAQTISNASTARFPLQIPIFRTPDGATRTFPFTLSVEGVGSKTGIFHFISHFLVPALVLPAVEVKQGENWVPFEQFSFGGGRTEHLRVRNVNGVQVKVYLDLSYEREEGERQAPAILCQMETWLAPGTAHEFDLVLPLYLDVPGGSGALRLWREATDGPGLSLADGEQVRYAAAVPQGLVEALFAPAQAVPVRLDRGEAPLQYGALFTCALLFAGESAPRTSYAYDARQANGASGGHRFAHSLVVGVEQDSPLQVVVDGRLGYVDSGQVNQLQVVSPKAGKAVVDLWLGLLGWKDEVEVKALPNQAPQVRGVRAEALRPQPGNVLNRQWLAVEYLVTQWPLRLVISAQDPDPVMGGLAQVVAQQTLAGAPSEALVEVEIPPQMLEGKEEVVLTPFAVDGRGGQTAANEEGQVRLGKAPQVVEVRFSPVAQGQRVLVFPTGRPGEQLVALGLEVDFDRKGRSQILSAQTLRVEPADHYRLIGGFVRSQRTPQGELLLSVQGGWDPATRRRTRWLSLHTQVGLVPRPSLGIYTAPDGQQWRQVFFPYVAQVQRVAKPVVWEEEGLAELGQLMAEEARAFLAAMGEEVLEAVAPFLPVATRLGSNYPNPFNSFTQIVFELAAEGWVQLGIYNLLGQEMRVLVEGHCPAGVYQAEWDGRDQGGRPVASGMYLYRLQTAEFQETRKMLLLK